MAYYRPPPPPAEEGEATTSPPSSDPPTDVTTTMMSPATTALLSNMSVAVVRKDACDRGVCESSAPDYDDDDDGDENDVGGDENEPVAGGGERHRSGGEGGVETRTTGRRRAPGPNEAAYLRDHDASVSRAMALHEARTRTNLRSVDSSLPDYKKMGQNERKEALDGVDRLLARLLCAAGAVGVGDGPEGGGPDRMHGTEKTPGWDDGEEDGGEDGEFRPHSTLGGPDDDATTLGDEDRDASSRLSASLLLHDTRTTLGGYDDDRDDDSRVHRSSSVRRSTSLLLDESAILLSSDGEDDRGCTSGGGEEEEEEEEEEERVERVRNNCHRMLLSPPAAASTTNELTPLLAHGGRRRRRASSKRCASNSGKRGSKARHRVGGGGRDDDDDDDDDVDDSFLGRFGGGGTAFPHDRDDDAFFSVMDASPIQRRYSCDGLDCSPRDYYDGEDGVVGGSRSIDVSTPLRDREGDDDPGKRRSAVAARRRGNDDNNIGALDGDHRASDEDSRFSALDNDDDDVVFEGGKEDHYDEDYADRDYDDDYDGDGDGAGDGGIVGNRNEAERPASQWEAFRTANAELTSTQLDRDGDDGDGDSPARQRAIRFDCASQKMMLKQSQQRAASQRGGDRRRTTEARLSELRVHDGDDEERSKEKENNADEDDPIQTVRNLCRRAKTTDELGMDSLEEVAPMDIRLRDGVNWKLDPLRCRQQDKDKISLNNKSKSSKKAKKAFFGTAKRKGNGDPESVLGTAPIDVARGSRAGESSESDKSLSDPEPSFKDPISDFPSRVAARLNAGLSFLVEKEARAQTGAGADECDYSSSALLSMTNRQILSVASKLLIQTRKSARLHQRAVTEPLLAKRLTPSSNAPPKDYDILAGGTLIVCRTKEDIEQWEVALREYTSLSVLSKSRFVGIESVGRFP